MRPSTTLHDIAHHELSMPTPHTTTRNMYVSSVVSVILSSFPPPPPHQFLSNCCTWRGGCGGGGQRLPSLVGAAQRQSFENPHAVDLCVPGPTTGHSSIRVLLASFVFVVEISHTIHAPTSQSVSIATFWLVTLSQHSTYKATYNNTTTNYDDHRLHACTPRCVAADGLH